MAEYWVNAIVTIRVPLDVAVDASREEKLHAACAAADEIDCDALTTVTFEDVVDGEPITWRR